MGIEQEDLVFRLRKRAEIRRQISTRKSVQEGKPDRIANLLDEAAASIEHYRKPDVLSTVIVCGLGILLTTFGFFLGELYGIHLHNLHP